MSELYLEPSPPVEHLNFYDNEGNLVKNIKPFSGLIKTSNDGSLIYAINNNSIFCYNNKGELNWKNELGNRLNIEVSTKDQIYGTFYKGEINHIFSLNKTGDNIFQKEFSGGKIIAFSDNENYLLLQKDIEKISIIDSKTLNVDRDIDFGNKKRNRIFQASLSEKHKLISVIILKDNTIPTLVIKDLEGNLIMDTNISKIISDINFTELYFKEDNLIIKCENELTENILKIKDLY